MREAVLNSQRYTLLTQRLSDVRQLRQAGKATPLDVTQAELNLVEARGQFTLKILEAHSAEARVRQAMELMADECGNAPQLLGACHECSPCADKTEQRRAGLIRRQSPGDLSLYEDKATPAQPETSPAQSATQYASYLPAEKKQPAKFEYAANIPFAIPPIEVNAGTPAVEPPSRQSRPVAPVPPAGSIFRNRRVLPQPATNHDETPYTATTGYRPSTPRQTR